MSGFSSNTESAGTAGLQILTSSTNSPETHFYHVLYNANKKNSKMCIICVPPLQEKKFSLLGCRDYFSEQVKAHYDRCLYELQNCYCATYDKKRNLVDYGRCLYNCVYHKRAYSPLPPNITAWNDEVCGKFNRRGSLCGSCEVNKYIMAYSYNLTCANCENNYLLNWLKFLFFAFFPLTVFYYVILLFHISIPSSSLQGYTLVAQLVSAPAIVRVAAAYCEHSVWYKYMSLLGTLYSIWNLDFFRFYNLGICLKTDTLATLALDLIVGVYPLVLIAITYLIIRLYDTNFITVLNKLWTPCKSFSTRLKNNWNLKTSVIDSFASFLLLSNVKFLNVCTDILIPVQVIRSDPLFNQSSSSWRMYYDASIEYFGPKHCPYAITAIVVLVVFVVLPTLLLLLYPFQRFQFFLNKFPSRWILVIKTLIDSFQGCYKDGTGSCKADYRWVSAFPFLIRIMSFLLYSIAPSNYFSYFESMLLIICAIIMICFEPFKDHTVNKSFVIFILLAAYFAVGLFGLVAHDSDDPSLHSQFFFLLLLGNCVPHLVIVLLLLKPLFKKVRNCFQPLKVILT